MSFLLALLFLAPLPTRAGRVEVVRYQSDALRISERYQVYLPPGYDAARAYPVVVLLHGLGGEGSDWFDPTMGDLHRIADAFINEQRVRPFVAIAPDGHDGYWTDHVSRAPGSAYGAAVIEALDHATKRFRLADVAAIVGVSAGGHGALSVGLVHASRFKAIVTISAALFDEPPTHRPIYLRVWGDPANEEHFARTAPTRLLRAVPPSTPLPALWLSVGKLEKERFLPWNLAAKELLTAKKIPHTFTLTDGGHGWAPWRALMGDWLVWLDAFLKP